MAGRDKKKLTLGLRTILRYSLELREAALAGERIGDSISFKEALNTPLVREQLAYLDIIGREILDRMDDDIDEHLAEMSIEDMESLDKLRDKMNSCPNCKKPLCENCNVCHLCDQANAPTHQAVNSKKPGGVN